jgi:hypothetical protein
MVLAGQIAFVGLVLYLAVWAGACLWIGKRSGYRKE